MSALVGDWSIRQDAYTKPLAIIVPYRERAEHLRQFVPHMQAYFERDKLDRYLRYTIHIVEPVGAGPFNRGRVKNAGFLLARETADYFCFHDVDYLPIWADYSYVDRPTRLIWHGPVLRETYDKYFGGVVAFNRADFELINGYSNEYWGWGYEDSDLQRRCARAGLTVGYRDGTYMALPHEHSGFQRDGSPTSEALAMGKVYERKNSDPVEHLADGLSNLRMEHVETRTGIPVDDGRPLPNVKHHFIRWT